MFESLKRGKEIKRKEKKYSPSKGARPPLSTGQPLAEEPSSDAERSPEVRASPELDVEMRESSPDPLDLLAQAEAEQDAFIAQSLVDLAMRAEQDSEYMTLEDAFEYALASKLADSKPSVKRYDRWELS